MARGECPSSAARTPFCYSSTCSGKCGGVCDSGTCLIFSIHPRTHFLQTAPRAVPPAPAPAPAPASVSSAASSKPQEDDKIGPVGTAYTPIKLHPKKLVNPFAAMEAKAQAEAAPPAIQHVGGKKLTWSERQALAKKQAEEEESRSRAASFHPSQPTAPAWTPPPAPAAPEPEEEESWEVCNHIVNSIERAHTYMQAPAPPPPPPAATRPPVPVAVEAAAPPPPPPPPPPPAAEAEPEYEEPAVEEAAPPPPVSVTAQLKPRYAVHAVLSLHPLLLHPLLLPCKRRPNRNPSQFLRLRLPHLPRRRRRARRVVDSVRSYSSTTKRKRTTR